MANCKEKFESLFKESYPLDDCDLDNYFNLAKIPYNPSYAYGENIPTLNEDVKDDLFISHHYAKFLKIFELKEQIWEILNEHQQRNKNEDIEQYVSGRDEYNRRKYTEACKKFEKAYQLYPSNDRGYYQWKIDILYQWGNAYFDLAELEDNISLFKKGYIKYKEALDFDAYQNSSFCNRDIANRVLHTPVEIQEHGDEAVAYYLAELGKSVTHLNEARIIIVGEKGAGKTSLARRLINPNAAMPTDVESAIGIDAFLWKPEHDDINIHIWDFAGHSVTHAVHKFFLSERCLYILVYDGRTEERNRLEYWLSQIKNYGGNRKYLFS